MTFHRSSVPVMTELDHEAIRDKMRADKRASLGDASFPPHRLEQLIAAFRGAQPRPTPSALTTAEVLRRIRRGALGLSPEPAPEDPPAADVAA